MKYVLFVCTHNAGRSQIAQAFFEKYAPADLRAESAGQEPQRQSGRTSSRRCARSGSTSPAQAEEDRRRDATPCRQGHHAQLPGHMPIPRRRRRGLGGRRSRRAANREGPGDPRRHRASRPRSRRDAGSTRSAPIAPDTSGGSPSSSRHSSQSSARRGRPTRSARAPTRFSTTTTTRRCARSWVSSRSGGSANASARRRAPCSPASGTELAGTELRDRDSNPNFWFQRPASYR